MTPAYELIRSKRRTVAVQVTRDARVIVRAPLRMPVSRIESFVTAHIGWIEKHVLETQNRLAGHDAQNGVWFWRGEPAAPPPGGKAAVEALLRLEARRIAEERTAHYSNLTGLSPAGVTITAARMRWGSCSAKKRVCFSYRIACLAPALADYIVVHELCHLREHNHSPRFWALVGSILPDYARLRRELREFERLLPP